MGSCLSLRENERRLQCTGTPPAGGVRYEHDTDTLRVILAVHPSATLSSSFQSTCLLPGPARSDTLPEQITANVGIEFDGGGRIAAIHITEASFILVAGKHAVLAKNKRVQKSGYGPITPAHTAFTVNADAVTCIYEAGLDVCWVCLGGGSGAGKLWGAATGMDRRCWKVERVPDRDHHPHISLIESSKGHLMAICIRRASRTVAGLSPSPS